MSKRTFKAFNVNLVHNFIFENRDTYPEVLSQSNDEKSYFLSVVYSMAWN